MSPVVKNTLINICHVFQCTISLKSICIITSVRKIDNVEKLTFSQKLVFKDITTTVHFTKHLQGMAEKRSKKKTPFALLCDVHKFFEIR